jgi:hypothetical protein
MSIDTTIRRVSDAATVAASTLVVRNAAKVGAQMLSKAPVIQDHLVRNTLLAGSASVAAGTFDMIQLIRKGDKHDDVAVTRGIGNSAQIIGGLMLMSKSANPDMKASGAVLIATGAIGKALDSYIPQTKSRFANNMIKGAVAGAATASVIMLAQGRLTSTFDGPFNPRAMLVTAAVGSVIGGIVAACNEHDEAAAKAAAK